MRPQPVDRAGLSWVGPPTRKRRFTADALPRMTEEGVCKRPCRFAQVQAGGAPNGKKDVLKTFLEMQLPFAGLSR